eukprot:5446233-Pyramimonas_sp.AAC.1
MIGDPAVVVGVEYGVTFSVGNFLACCRANTSVHNVEYGPFLVKHGIYFAFVKPISREVYGRLRRVTWAPLCSTFPTGVADFFDHI